MLEKGICVIFDSTILGLLQKEPGGHFRGPLHLEKIPSASFNSPYASPSSSKRRHVGQ